MRPTTFDRNSPDLVIALHCSGSGAAQWRRLGAVLAPACDLIAPEHYGCESVGPWTGAHPFTVADEAARSIALIDATDRKVHLVGHSYGGGVAMHVALARPDRIASLTLYEPSAFYLLRQFDGGEAPFEEIRTVAYDAATGVVTGDYRAAAIRFIDYWGGAGAFDALRPALQDALVKWMPKAPLDFHALLTQPTHWSAFATLLMPTLIIRGEHAPAPTRLIADTLPSIFRNGQQTVVPGAGHMGPVTHADEVNALMVRHIGHSSRTVAREQRAA